ncbi:hypothetical protein ACQP1S_02620 [Micromonospora matsumotoense]|uniref:hypothetical protein n=1 Tax=Micromonospora matsumotoense TaxID=121616 RepID=UPI003D8E943B
MTLLTAHILRHRQVPRREAKIASRGLSAAWIGDLAASRPRTEAGRSGRNW